MQPVVVVVVDTGSPSALNRTLEALTRTAPSARIVVALKRGRGAPVAHLRVATFVADATEDAVRRRVNHPAPAATVTITTDLVVADGWLDAVLAPLVAGAELSKVQGIPTTDLLAQRGGLTGRVLSTTPVEVTVPGVLTGALVHAAQQLDPTRPLVSAVLIVKDEQEVLAGCLQALSPFADEVVVYDTGSSDASVEIAEEAGARVVRGTWDDHFGRARNRALDHARGHWVLSVDADEVVRGDAAALREQLRRDLLSGESEMLGVTVRSVEVEGGTAATEGIVGRIFRADVLHWRGALHEQLVRRDGSAELPAMRLTTLMALDHSGYAPVRWGEKGKAQRNLHIATAAAAAGSHDDPSKTWSNLGRALVVAGRSVEAVAALANVDVDDPRAAMVVEAGEAAFWAATMVGNLGEATRWLAVLERRGENRERLRFYRGRLLVVRGDVDEGVQLMSAAVEHVDAAGRRFSPSEALGAVLEALTNHGRQAEAADRLVAAAALGQSMLALTDVYRFLERAGRPLDDYLVVVPSGEVKSVLGQLLRFPPAVCDPALETLWSRGEAVGSVLAAAAMAALALPVSRAVEWSQRLRAAGFAEGCPLRRIATAAERSPSDRALAAAACWEGFGEDDVRPALDAALAEIDDADVEAFLAVLQPLAPGLAGQLEPVTS